MKKKPKIAVIGLKGLPAFGGAAAVGENIIEQLKDRYIFTVYSISSHTNYQTGNYKDICHQIVLKAIRFKKLNSLLYYLRSAVHALFCSYDLIHLHHRDAAFVVPLLRIRHKVIITLHGFGTKDLSDKWNQFKLYFWIQENVFVKLANHITSVSKKDYFTINKTAKSKYSYIPNGVETPQIQVFEKAQSYDIVFAASRIVSFKGCHTLLKALNMIKFNGRVAIVGDLDSASQYGKEIQGLSKNLNVSFLGLIKDKKLLHALIKQASVFVFPSLTEAMSMMLLEAVACKTPVIASNIDANTNLFSSEEMLFFKSGKESDLGVKIKQALSNIDASKKMANKAYLRISNEYKWEMIAKEYDLLFRQILTKST